ncbi:hypothetical protein AB0J80_33760 [Actinoplanes sp. NPDC049548]|uniref:hypothetical protein n=1 Tax=Actinoplanes sp. NPDC049548 TaxID=3155152 RepID=UPI003414B9E0
MTMRRALLLTALVPLLAAGCSEPHSPAVATAGTGGSTATSGTAAPPVSARPKESDYDKALRYTRCMTENGAKMPDPVEGEPLMTGDVVVADEPMSAVEARLAAFGKCRQLMPATWPVKADPKEVARSAAYNRCMKQHGVPVYEPEADGMWHAPTNSDYMQTPEYRAAEQDCRHLVDDPANDTPENR